MFKFTLINILLIIVNTALICFGVYLLTQPGWVFYCGLFNVIFSSIAVIIATIGLVKN